MSNSHDVMNKPWWICRKHMSEGKKMIPKIKVTVKTFVLRKWLKNKQIVIPMHHFVKKLPLKPGYLSKRSNLMQHNFFTRKCNLQFWDSTAIIFGHLGGWYVKSTPYTRFLNWKKKRNRKSRVVTDKTLNLTMICVVHFVYPTLVVSTLAPDGAVLYGNITFLILVLSTEKRWSTFLKRVYDFQKICFKVEVLKTFKTASDCHVKRYWFRKRRAILKIHCPVF